MYFAKPTFVEEMADSRRNFVWRATLQKPSDPISSPPASRRSRPLERRGRGDDRRLHGA